VLKKGLIVSRKQKEYRSPFSGHLPLEFTLAIFFCLFLLLSGLPGLITKRSFLSGLMTFAGFTGLAAMFISSLLSERRSRIEKGTGYSFDDFVPAVFFFFIILGLTAGLSLGYIQGSWRLALIYSLVGLLLGCIIGVFAGIGINYLGWIGIYLVYLGYLLMLGMAILDLILIYLFFA